MAISGRLALFTWLCAGFFLPGHAEAAENPNLGSDRVRQETLAPRWQAERAASAAKALPLDLSKRARLQEIVPQLPSIRPAARPVLDDQLAPRPEAAMAEAEPLAREDRAGAEVSEEGVGTSEACAHRFELIRRGEERCGISLGEDDRIHVAGRAIGEPIVGWGRPNRLFVSPVSPGGQYRIVDACGEMCGKAFVLDLQRHSLRDTFAGRYGPEKDWILWSPDAAYAALANEDEGFAWLYMIRASDGASWEVLNQELVVRPESARWLDERTFEVDAVSCRGGLQACAAAVEGGATGDPIRVTLTVNGPKSTMADGRR